MHVLLGTPRALRGVKAHGEDETWVALLLGGERVCVRMARLTDAAAVQAMHHRCSPETRYLRYFGTASYVPASLLPALLGTAPDAVALVAEAPDRRLIGLANLITDHDGDTGEIALLVEDSWQRRGLGTALVRRLVTVAREHGLGALTAVTLLNNGRPARVLARAGLCVELRVVDGLLELYLPLPAGTGHARRPRLGDACPSWPGRRDEPQTTGDEARRETEQGSLGKLVVG